MVGRLGKLGCAQWRSDRSSGRQNRARAKQRLGLGRRQRAGLVHDEVSFESKDSARAPKSSADFAPGRSVTVGGRIGIFAIEALEQSGVAHHLAIINGTTEEPDDRGTGVLGNSRVRNNVEFWWMIDRSRSRACSGDRMSTCSPCSQISPPPGLPCEYRSTLHSVDLPAPFSPQRLKTSPGRRSRSGCRTRFLTPGNVFEILF